MKQTRAEAEREQEKARMDAQIFGTGAVRTYADGRVEHVPIVELELFLKERREHNLGGECWCKPIVDGKLVKHRSST